jgi:3-hydroxyisobutyrate dehydrogenase
MRVTLIGVGNMGEPMAANLVRRGGFEVTLFDADRARASAVAARLGCRAAGTLAEAARCEVCVTMLPTGAIVAEVLTAAEDGAFLAHAAPGTVVVDMSSSEPLGTQATGRALAAHGAVLLDAPVSGGVARAVDATLAIMIGADDEAAVERARPVLEALGQRLFRVGPLGAGHAMKAANNFVAAATYAATAEALAIGQRCGLDPRMMIDIMNVSTGRSFVSEVVMQEHVLTGRYATGFTLGLLAKDVGIAAALGEELGVDAPLTRLTRERWNLACERRGAARDHSEALLGWYGPSGPEEKP